MFYIICVFEVICCSGTRINLHWVLSNNWSSVAAKHLSLDLATNVSRWICDLVKSKYFLNWQERYIRRYVQLSPCNALFTSRQLSWYLLHKLNTVFLIVQQYFPETMNCILVCHNWYNLAISSRVDCANCTGHVHNMTRSHRERYLNVVGTFTHWSGECSVEGHFGMSCLRVGGSGMKEEEELDSVVNASRYNMSNQKYYGLASHRLVALFIPAMINFLSKIDMSVMESRRSQHLRRMCCRGIVTVELLPQ